MKIFQKKYLVYFPYLLFIPFFFFLFKIYYARVNDFGCFDDCFNFMGGYFLLKGKILYTTIFYNHQMLMAYISFIIQKYLHPSTLYTLILYHRLFVLAFAFIFNILLIVRFRKVGAWFVVIYELTKYYLFGDRFLAEGLIVYPLVYLMAMIWDSWEKRKMHSHEIIFAGLLSWFIIFSREPYIPLAIILYSVVLWQNRHKKDVYLSLILFLLLSIGILMNVNMKDYFFNVFTINKQTVGGMEFSNDAILGIGGIKIIAYPFWILTSKIWSSFRQILIALDIVFLIELVISVIKCKKWKEALLVFIILSIANIRFVIPGNIFYASFHMLPWYGLFIFITGNLLTSIVIKKYKTFGNILFCLFSIVFLLIIFSHNYFIWDKIDRQKEFVTNFGEILSNGSVIKELSNPSSTLFLDGHDDMIYWESTLSSTYKYSWYTSVMPRFLIFTKARNDMFIHTPPDFYYAYCPPNAPHSQQLPTNLVNAYVPLYFSGKPTCVFIKKNTISAIGKDKWNNIKNYGYYLP